MATTATDRDRAAEDARVKAARECDATVFVPQLPGAGDPIDKPTVGNVPALAAIVKQLEARPYWERDRPLPVAKELFTAGRREMIEQMEKRGYKLPVDIMLERERENFLVRGTAVIVEVS